MRKAASSRATDGFSASITFTSHLTILAVVPTPAVPLAAIRRDGLERVVWVEDPSNKSTLICIPVQVLDESDGWAWIESLIEPGMRVVVRGAGRLSLAVSGSESSGGHFHADGTFHAEDD